MDAFDDPPLLRVCIRRGPDRVRSNATASFSPPSRSTTVSTRRPRMVSVGSGRARAPGERRTRKVLARESTALRAAPAGDHDRQRLDSACSCFLLVIWLLPSLEAAATFGWNWRSIGSMDAGLVASGQWWRTVTALTLHGDLGHLMGNSLFGAVFGMFAGRHLGSGLAWLLVLLCGARRQCARCGGAA